MIHGKCKSAGCYAMTDALIEEIYALARESFIGGQEAIHVDAFPFRMTDANLARHKSSPHHRFWLTLKDGYDFFEAARQPASVVVCERRYVVNASYGNRQRPRAGRGLPAARASRAGAVHAAADAGGRIPWSSRGRRRGRPALAGRCRRDAFGPGQRRLSARRWVLALTRFAPLDGLRAMLHGSVPGMPRRDRRSRCPLIDTRWFLLPGRQLRCYGVTVLCCDRPQCVRVSGCGHRGGAFDGVESGSAYGGAVRALVAAAVGVTALAVAGAACSALAAAPAHAITIEIDDVASDRVERQRAFAEGALPLAGHAGSRPARRPARRQGPEGRRADVHPRLQGGIRARSVDAEGRAVRAVRHLSDLPLGRHHRAEAARGRQAEPGRLLFGRRRASCTASAAGRARSTSAFPTRSTGPTAARAPTSWCTAAARRSAALR